MNFYPTPHVAVSASQGFGKLPAGRAGLASSGAGAFAVKAIAV
jgi:hypothetical protein